MNISGYGSSLASNPYAAGTRGTAAAARNSQGQPLSEAQQKEVDALKKRDQEVRQHEQAHQSASGGLSSGSPSFSYQSGPDGQRYAVGGEVNIDVSPGSTPQETLNKAQKIQAAARAPAEPSGQDRSVAQQAAQMALQAQQEIREQAAQGKQQGGNSQRLANSYGAVAATSNTGSSGQLINTSA